MTAIYRETLLLDLSWLIQLKNVAIKLDMNKAYDRLDWDFLKATLRAFGFNQRWVDLVMTLVTMVTYQYKINGFLSPPNPS